jgi:hypothetical protein
MKTPVALTVHDRDLIHLLKEEKVMHEEKAEYHEKEKKAHLKIAKLLNNASLAKKFDVAESTIRRVLSNNV